VSYNIEIHPLATVATPTYAYYDKPVREGKIKRFPYTVVYEIFDKTIVIYSVFMAKQNPSKKRTF